MSLSPKLHANPACSMHVDAARVDVPFHCKCDARIAVRATLSRGGGGSRWRAEVEGNDLLSSRGLARTFKTPERAYRAAADFIAAAKAKEDALVDFHQPKEPAVKRPSKKKSPLKVLKETSKKRDAPKDLPKTFQGAEVVRGEGMNADKLDAFLERNAMDQFDATREMWIVLEERVLEDLDGSCEVKGFATKDDALVYARARSNGNVDHRVLRVADQVLVVGTMNEL